MSNSRDLRITLGVFLSLVCACQPINNLDKAAGGRSGIATESRGGEAFDAGSATSSGGMGGSTSSAASGGAIDAATGETALGGNPGSGAGSLSRGMGGQTGSAGGSAMGGTAGQAASGGGAGTSAASGTVDAGGTIDASGTVDAGGTGGAGGGSGPSCSAAPDLPDIVSSPVQGKIIYSAGASWDIDGKQWPAFEIHTPTANYWLVKSAAAIVSITDTSGVQWINFSSGFRPNRGVPNLGSCCQPGDPEKLKLPMMVTDVDPSFTVTSTHLRLISKSDNGGYHLVWDFFLTHFTLTVNCAEKPFGFTYRGVPAGAINDGDLLVSSSGASLSPKSPYSGDLSGPAEWVYYNHTSGQHALFLIQHADDALTDSYQIADGDTAMWTFGGDQSKRYLSQTPIRFSLGLMDSSDDAKVTERIGFVVSATP